MNTKAKDKELAPILGPLAQLSLSIKIRIQLAKIEEKAFGIKKTNNTTGDEGKICTNYILKINTERKIF